MIDPYKVLGVPKSASQDEIKKAYRKKAKENHPDLHPDDPEAAKKMNDINLAYDMLTNPSKYSSQNAYYGDSDFSGSGNGSSGPYSGYNGQYRYDGQNGWYSFFDFSDFFSGFSYSDILSPSYESNDSQSVRDAIDMINGNNCDRAVEILNGIESTARDARWYYLCAVSFYRQDDYDKASEYSRMAVKLDPNNLVYRRIYNKSVSSGSKGQYSSYRNGYGNRTGGRTSGSFYRVSGVSCLIRFILYFILFRTVTFLIRFLFGF